MKTNHLFVLCSTILLCLTGCYLTGCVGQFLYELNIDHFESPRRDALIDYGTVRARKYNRTQHILDGHFEFLLPFSDDIDMIINFFGYSGNDYVQIFQRNITRVCSFIRDEPVVMDDIMESTSLGIHPKCPIAPGRYHFYNTKIPHRPLLAWMGMFGKFRFNFTYLLRGEPVSRFAVYFVKVELKFLG